MEAQRLADDLDPIAEKINDHGGQGSGVQRNVEHQSGILPSEQPGSQRQMRGTADGKEFGETLDDGEDDHLIGGHE